jgi:hypothetical protein
LKNTRQYDIFKLFEVRLFPVDNHKVFWSELVIRFFLVVQVVEVRHKHWDWEGHAKYAHHGAKGTTEKGHYLISLNVMEPDFSRQ